MVGIVLLGVFVLLLAFGAPIAVCLGMSSVGAILRLPADAGGRQGLWK